VEGKTSTYNGHTDSVSEEESKAKHPDLALNIAVESFTHLQFGAATDVPPETNKPNALDTKFTKES
jgi:hypothetical protein